MNTLTVTLTDGAERTFHGNFRELSLLRARLLMALDGEEIGVIQHRLSTGAVSLRADQLAEVGRVCPA